MLIGMPSPRRGVAVEVRPGRYTADIDGDFVVFLIGIRVNHPLRVRGWRPVVAAMPKMLKVLSQHPELGCLGFEKWFGRTTMLVQYWRDFDSLDRFARGRQHARARCPQGQHGSRAYRRQHYRRAGRRALLTRHPAMASAPAPGRLAAKPP